MRLCVHLVGWRPGWDGAWCRGSGRGPPCAVISCPARELDWEGQGCECVCFPSAVATWLLEGVPSERGVLHSACPPLAWRGTGERAVTRPPPGHP